MDIEVVSGAAPNGWNDLVADDEAATFFHTGDWADALCQTGHAFDRLHLVARADGRPVGGIPIVRRRIGFVSILSSMPYGTYGGLVVRPDAPPETGRALLAAFAGMARSPAVAAAHLIDLAERVCDDLAGFRVFVEEAHVLRLERSWKETWDGFRPSARNKIRKARKAGVTVRRATTESDFLAYHHMLLECSRRWGQACQFGPGFFGSLSAMDPQLVQMWLAEHQGEIIGGDLNFVLHGRIMNWGNVSRDRARHLAPNNLLHATAIERGIEAGCSIYDLGSSGGIEGVDAFKAAFGTEKIPLKRHSLEKPWYRAVRRLARTHGPGEDQ